MKKLICLALALCLCAGLTAPALALGEGDARVVVGADLTDDQVALVYSNFALARGSVTELTVTNAEERDYLEGVADESIIGTRSISCVYIRILSAGSGLSVTTSNINWCTKEMYTAALMTAGITDAEVKVGAPFSVSGTAALTGIYKAYEDLTGTTLSADAKQTAADELVITAQLADELSGYDAVSIVNELKLILAETQNLTDDEVRAEIGRIAGDYGYTLSDSEVDRLLKLCRSLEGLDSNELLDQVQGFQKTLKTLSSAAEGGGKITQWLKETADGLGEKLSGWLEGLITKLKG